LSYNPFKTAETDTKVLGFVYFAIIILPIIIRHITD